MKKNLVVAVVVFSLISGCAPIAAATPTGSPSTAAANETFPQVVGPEPSNKVAAFYYPWYGTATVDGEWNHWDQADHQPPQSIGSDYFPALGAYSSNDPQVVAQHMAWLRQAGVGVIISSWWGPGSYEDKAVPLLLEMAERYGIKVTFHIEPYGDRTASSLVEDVKYLYAQYGGSPAFFRTNANSRNSPGDQAKGMFFVWAIGYDQEADAPVPAEYWLPAMDEIHALPEGALIIANTLQSNWVNDAHVDGLYNYITLHLEEENGFDWARSLPPDSLYVPSVMPGNSARRVGYPESTYVARLDGETYNEQWETALGTGIEPEMVTITSFNEWHEGSIIEPPAFGVDDGAGNIYADFGTLPADSYLALTNDWVTKFLAIDWPNLATYRVRIQVTTTSDWTTLSVVSGGMWMRPERFSASETVIISAMENGDNLVLTQALEDARGGNQVQMTWDVFFNGLNPDEELVLVIERGAIGTTQVTIYNYSGATPVEVGSFAWAGINGDRSPFEIQIPAADLISR